MKCEKVSLFDLACWKNGLAFKNIQFADKGKPIIKIAELKNGITTQTRFTEQVFDDNVSLKKGDMLFSWSGNPETSIDVYWYELLDGWLNQHIFKVTPKGFVDKFYLYYLLKSFKKVFTNIASNKQTTGLGHVTVKDLKEIFVNLPDLSYQRLIGEYLNKIDEKIRINNRINDNLEKQMELYFRYLFIDNINSNWEIGCIADIGTVIGGGTPSKAKSEYYTNNGIAWITPKDLSNQKSKFISRGENDITELGLKNSSAKIMPKGTILFSSRAPIGYIAIANNDITTNQGFKSIIPNIEFGTSYIYYLLKQNIPIIESMASGSTFKEVSGKTMKEIPVIIPDLTTLATFNNFCNKLFEKQKNLEKESLILANIRNYLLNILMSNKFNFSKI